MQKGFKWMLFKLLNTKLVSLGAWGRKHTVKVMGARASASRERKSVRNMLWASTWSGGGGTSNKSRKKSFRVVINEVAPRKHRNTHQTRSRTHYAARITTKNIKTQHAGDWGSGMSISAHGGYLWVGTRTIRFKEMVWHGKGARRGTNGRAGQHLYNTFM